LNVHDYRFDDEGLDQAVAALPADAQHTIKRHWPAVLAKTPNKPQALRDAATEIFGLGLDRPMAVDLTLRLAAAHDLAEAIALEAIGFAESPSASSAMVETGEHRTEKNVQPLSFFNASAWQGQMVPPRRWLVPHRIPMANVTLLQGDGAAGKTTITLQLCVAVDQGTDWLGAVVEESGAAMFFSAEEDGDEIHRRLSAILDHRGLEFSALQHLHALGIPEDDPTLGALVGGKIVPTTLYNRLEQAACDVRPKLLAIEAAADVFGGDENNRTQVRQFLGLLRRLAKKSDAAILLLQHPSLSGMTSGTGNSGSTHWSNSVRSRLYFSRPKADANSDDDNDQRQLEVKKSNYGPAGERIVVRWEGGLFVPDGGVSSPERVAKERAVEEVFLRCLDAKRVQQIEVVATRGRGYAPTVFEGMPEAAGFKMAALQGAMERLLTAGRIRNDRVGGPNSRPKHGLVRL
jgi:RecA-family ATPase